MTLRCKGCGADVAEDGTTTYDGPPKEGEHTHDTAPPAAPPAIGANQPENDRVNPPATPAKITMFQFLED